MNLPARGCDIYDMGLTIAVPIAEDVLSRSRASRRHSVALNRLRGPLEGKEGQGAFLCSYPFYILPCRFGTRGRSAASREDQSQLMLLASLQHL